MKGIKYILVVTLGLGSFSFYSVFFGADAYYTLQSSFLKSIHTIELNLEMLSLDAGELSKEDRILFNKNKIFYRVHIFVSALSMVKAENGVCGGAQYDVQNYFDRLILFVRDRGLGSEHVENIRLTFLRKSSSSSVLHKLGLLDLECESYLEISVRLFEQLDDVLGPNLKKTSKEQEVKGNIF